MYRVREEWDPVSAALDGDQALVEVGWEVATPWAEGPLHGTVRLSPALPPVVCASPYTMCRPSATRGAGGILHQLRSGVVAQEFADLFYAMLTLAEEWDATHSQQGATAGSSPSARRTWTASDIVGHGCSLLAPLLGAAKGNPYTHALGRACDVGTMAGLGSPDLDMGDYVAGVCLVVMAAPPVNAPVLIAKDVCVVVEWAEFVKSFNVVEEWMVDKACDAIQDPNGSKFPGKATLSKWYGPAVTWVYNHCRFEFTPLQCRIVVWEVSLRVHVHVHVMPIPWAGASRPRRSLPLRT